jgi:hypothetical protein
MANAASNKLKYLLATGAVDFANDTFIGILMNSTYVFNKDTHEKYADISASELATLNGYTQKTLALTLDAVTEDDTNDRCDVTFDNATWLASGGAIGPSAGMIIIDDTEANDAVVGYIDFGGAYTQAEDGTLVVSGITIRLK